MVVLPCEVMMFHVSVFLASIVGNSGLLSLMAGFIRNYVPNFIFFSRGALFPFNDISLLFRLFVIHFLL